MKFFRIIMILSLILQVGCATTRNPMFSKAFTDEVREAEKLIEAGNYPQATDELDMLLAMDPENERARFLRGLAWQKWERYENATSDYEISAAGKTTNIKVYYNLGMIYAFKLNLPRQALESFDRFLTLAPHHEEAFNVARVMASLDGPEVDLNPSLHGLMEEALGITDFRKRREKLMEGTLLNLGSPTFYYLVGQTYEAEGNSRKATSYYQQAIEKRPTCSRCHRSLGNILIQGKREAEGQIHLIKAKLFDPNG